MGLSISPILAEIFLYEILDTKVMNLEFSPKLYLRYVDDILVVINKNNLNSFHKFLENLHPKIIFYIRNRTK